VDFKNTGHNKAADQVDCTLCLMLRHPLCGLTRKDKRTIGDEFFGFMAAGHDTLASTVAWTPKLLTENLDPAAQSPSQGCYGASLIWFALVVCYAELLRCHYEGVKQFANR
jgi:cytochrome P450